MTLISENLPSTWRERAKLLRQWSGSADDAQLWERAAEELEQASNGRPRGLGRERQRAQNERRDKGGAARVAELTRFDAWLTEVLESPLPVEAIELAAKQGGMRWRRDCNHPGVSVQEAADRLRVFGFQEKAAGTSAQSGGSWSPSTASASACCGRLRRRWLGCAERGGMKSEDDS